MIIRNNRRIVAAFLVWAIVGHRPSMPEVESELYKLIKVSGRDASVFLQGQLTQDVSLLRDTPSLPAAWCNPQGRVIVTMRLVAMADSIGLMVPATTIRDVCDRLARYKLRAEVEITTAGSDWRCIAIFAAPPKSLQQAATSWQDGDIIMTAYRTDSALTEVCGPANLVTGFSGAAELAVDDWAKRLIHAGVPCIGAGNSEKFTPHMLNLDRLGAISFNKGCYTGQEVIARTQHLGSSKRRLMHYRSDSLLPAIGQRLQHQGTNVGEVVNAAGAELLAVTPVALHGEVLQIDGVGVKPVGLPY